MAFKEGEKRPSNAGRKKGVANKNVQQLRDMILNALAKAGNDDYLYQQSLENPVAFMNLIGKILPKQVDVDASLNGNLVISHITREIIDPLND